MKFINDIEKDGIDLNGLKVLLRLDLNVPVANEKVVDDYRIRKALRTIEFLKQKGSKIIIISHIETKDNSTLGPVCHHFSNLGIDCYFEKNYRNVNKVIEENQIVLLENIRNFEDEKENNKSFAKELASLADIYINDAFSVSHRKHASVCAITEFIPSYAGLQFQDELNNLKSAFEPDRPFLFIIGGAKFDTKLPLIKKFINIADKVFIGGALVHDIYKAKGMDIGKSLISDKTPDLTGIIDSKKLIIPIDSNCKDKIIYDIGEKTIDFLKEEVKKYKFILWNGPMGAYEGGYKKGTIELAKALAQMTENGTKTIVGGGDTLATIRELNIENSFTFVSTAGGAMLDYLSEGTLLGIEALGRGVH